MKKIPWETLKKIEAVEKKTRKKRGIVVYWKRMKLRKTTYGTESKE